MSDNHDTVAVVMIPSYSFSAVSCIFLLLRACEREGLAFFFRPFCYFYLGHPALPRTQSQLAAYQSRNS